MCDCKYIALKKGTDTNYFLPKIQLFIDFSMASLRYFELLIPSSQTGGLLCSGPCKVVTHCPKLNMIEEKTLYNARISPWSFWVQLTANVYRDLQGHIHSLFCNIKVKGLWESSVGPKAEIVKWNDCWSKLLWKMLHLFILHLWLWPTAKGRSWSWLNFRLRPKVKITPAVQHCKNLQGDPIFSML